LGDARSKPTVIRSTPKSTRYSLHDEVSIYNNAFRLRKGADKSLVFLLPAEPKQFFFDGLKLQQRSHNCVELRGDWMYRVNTFFQSVTCCFLHNAKDLSAPS
jgi:hypothetical protein